MSAIRTAVASVRGVFTRPGRATSALLLSVVCVNALYLIGLIAAWGQNDPLVTVGLGLATRWIPVSILWLVAVRTGFTQLPVILAAAAVTFTSAGDAYYGLAMDADGYLPFPSPADAAYLLFYPLMVAALVVLVRRQFRGVGRLFLLETAVATLGAAAVLAVVLSPVIGDTLASDNAIVAAIALAYPLFDLLLLGVLVGIAAAGAVRVGRRGWALITGLGLFAVADVVYALLMHEGLFTAGTPLDAAWAVGLGFLSWWVAGVPQSDTPTAAASRDGLLVAIPAVAVVAGLAILVIGTQVRLSVLAVILAALTVGLGAAPIIFRQAMLGRTIAFQEEDLRRLTELDQDKVAELDRASEVQRALLPKVVPPLEGYEVAGACVPAKSVGGDFFDWYAIEGGLAITLADVMGKGVGAGIIAATVRATIRSARRDDEVVVAVGRVAEALAEDLSQAGSFVTLFHARLRAADGCLSFVDAGHGLTIVVGPDGVAERLSTTDLPLGTGFGGAATSRDVVLEKGGTLVSFSDGVLDLYDGSLAAADRVAEIVRASSSAAEVVAEIERLARRDAAPDDVTVVAIRRLPETRW